MTQFFSHYPFFPLPLELLFNIGPVATADGADGDDAAGADAAGVDAADGDAEGHELTADETSGADMTYDPFLGLKVAFGMTLRQRLLAMGKVKFEPIEDPAAYYDVATRCMVYKMPPPGWVDFDMATREAGWHGDRDQVARELAASCATVRAQGGDLGLLAWFDQKAAQMVFPVMPAGANDVDAETRELGPQ